MRYVYVLRSSKDGNLYTGYTTDLRQQVADHLAGRVCSTRNRRPLQLIYYEAYLSAKDAESRELFLETRLRQALHPKACLIGFENAEHLSVLPDHSYLRDVDRVVDAGHSRETLRGQRKIANREAGQILTRSNGSRGGIRANSTGGREDRDDGGFDGWRSRT